ncbi:unnamed protein product [Oncorhynchus mykiss]|uniref:Uncharacterized protein n=1 Tax=Oncorhynchus mykiss TaxID=8022 RepID=A0A060VP23_ONCMY|nr:unnamed protein product [Oncorhynchus mykiss]
MGQRGSISKWVNELSPALTKIVCACSPADLCVCSFLIVSLKREIQCLKEELSMVTGEKREDQLTQEEIHKMEELVKVFLEDPDCEVTLALGPDMRKIHYCFSLLKVMIRERLSIGDEVGDHPSPPPPVVVPDQKDSPQLQPADLTKLREMLTQRDNEISILPMLQPYKYYSSSSLSSVCDYELENVLANTFSISVEVIIVEPIKKQLSSRKGHFLPDHQKGPPDCGYPVPTFHVLTLCC